MATTSQSLPALLSTSEACELLRCAPPTLRRYAREFNWDRVRVNQRKVLYKREQLLAHIEKNTYRVRG